MQHEHDHFKGIQIDPGAPDIRMPALRSRQGTAAVRDTGPRRLSSPRSPIN
jgi:hypothetical protein